MMEEFMRQHYKYELNKMQLIVDCKQEVIDDIIAWHQAQTGYYDECGKKTGNACSVCEWIEKMKEKHL